MGTYTPYSISYNSSHCYYAVPALGLSQGYILVGPITIK